MRYSREFSSALRWKEILGEQVGMRQDGSSLALGMPFICEFLVPVRNLEQ